MRYSASASGPAKTINNPIPVPLLFDSRKKGTTGRYPGRTPGTLLCSNAGQWDVVFQTQERMEHATTA
ncbi:hypothetical protein RHS02_00015, partial [Rhizoctonia solani]